MRKIRGCSLCTLGDCMCHRVISWNNIRNIKTPPDFQEGYQRKYLINTYHIDPSDRTNADRYIEILQNWNLPAFHPNRRYQGDDGYRRFIHDLEALKPKPVPW